MVVPSLDYSSRRILFIRCNDTVLNGCQVWQQYLTGVYRRVIAYAPT